MTPRIYPSIIEAIHGTAVSYRLGMKSLAAELDMSPSELSHRTTLGGDSARPLSADCLVKLMAVTGDVSILATLADLVGFEIRPKADRLPEMVANLTEAAKGLSKEIQMLLDFGAQHGDPKRARR